MFLIIILSLVVGYLYVGNKYEVKSFNHRISELEATLQKNSDEYETKIAILKKETARQIAHQNGRSTGHPLTGLLKKVVHIQQSAERDALDEMGRRLNLEADQASRIEEILNDFKKTKHDLLVRSRNEKLTIFARPAEGFNAARKEALGKIQTVLNDEQYRRMIEYQYDQRFGLKIAESPEPEVP